MLNLVNRYDYEDVKIFIEEESDCRLVSMTYQGVNYPLRLICGCGNIFEQSYRTFVRSKRKCPECVEVDRVKLVKSRPRRSHSDFVRDLKSKHGDEYVLVGDYVAMGKKVTIKHSKCGYSWSIIPSSILGSSRCRKCFGTHRKTTSSYRKQLLETKGDDYSLLSEYENAKKKVKIRHVCGFEYEGLPNNILKRNCPKCSKLVRKDTKYFTNEVYSLVGEEYTVLGEYKNAKTHILMRHNCDNCWDNEYYVVPDAFIRGVRCPKCIGSLGEKRVEKYLMERGISYINQYRIPECRNKNPLPFDFAVIYKGRLHCLIEYDGEQHYNKTDWFGGKDNYENTKRNDKIKSDFCLDNNIKLIRIPYWDYKNIEGILDNEIKITIKE